MEREGREETRWGRWVRRTVVAAVLLVVLLVVGVGVADTVYANTDPRPVNGSSEELAVIAAAEAALAGVTTLDAAVQRLGAWGRIEVNHQHEDGSWELGVRVADRRSLIPKFVVQEQFVRANRDGATGVVRVTTEVWLTGP